MPPETVVSDEVSERAWDAYVQAHPDATADHVWRWRAVFRDVFGHESTYLAAVRGGDIVGTLPLVRFRSRLFGRFLSSVPFLNYGGLLVSDADAGLALLARAREVAQRFGASHIELRHVARQLPQLPCRQHKIGLRLNLPDAPPALWDSVDRKARNQVRKAQKEGLVAVAGGAEQLDDFYAVFSRNMRDLGTPVYPKALFATTLRLFPQEAECVVVRRGSVAMAGSLTIRFRDTVIVPWASSLREHRHLCPNMLLYWTMLERAIASGARRFDFGRSSPDAGTLPFKRQWGAEEFPLHWEYVLLTRTDAPDHGPSSPRFERAVRAWSHLPLWLTNTLGPAIVRNIP
jgi:FemAB-related protein (PEP-CTERM system-associated)